MRITITKDFDTPEAAAEFLARLGNPAHVVGRLTADPVPEAVAERTAVLVDALKARKPRADAGKKREPYGPRTTTHDGAPVGAGNGEAGLEQPAAGSPEKEIKGSTPPAVAPTVAAPTLADARAAMKKLNDAEGMGMGVCIESLKKFGVTRISDLKPELFAEFIKYVRAQLPAAK